MRGNPAGLSDFLAAQHGDSGNRTLLLVDQFEELFTLCKDEAERTGYIANLLTAADLPRQSGQPSDLVSRSAAVILLTFHADFYAACGQYDNLRAALETHQRYIGAMNEDELQRTVELPAERGRWAFQVGLVDLILEDAGAEEGALPLLSHALLETWRRRSGRVMTLSGYRAAGGVKSAIARTAQSVYDGLDLAEREVARRIFLRLVDPGDGENATRRREQRSTLLPAGDEDSPEAKVLLKLSSQNARLIIVDGDTVQIAHEALIRAWPQLGAWLRTYRSKLDLLESVRKAAQAWAAAPATEQENLLVHRGGRLDDAVALLAVDHFPLTAEERAYILAGKTLRDRTAERQRHRAAAQDLDDPGAEYGPGCNSLCVRRRLVGRWERSLSPWQPVEHFYSTPVLSMTVEQGAGRGHAHPLRRHDAHRGRLHRQRLQLEHLPAGPGCRANRDRWRRWICRPGFRRLWSGHRPCQPDHGLRPHDRRPRLQEHRRRHALGAQHDAATSPFRRPAQRLRQDRRRRRLQLPKRQRAHLLSFRRQRQNLAAAPRTAV